LFPSCYQDIQKWEIIIHFCFHCKLDRWSKIVEMM
jgi:hypothetical protein